MLVKALRSMRYNTRMMTAGDEFTVRPSLGRVLVALGRVERVEKPAFQKTSPLSIVGSRGAELVNLPHTPDILDRSVADLVSYLATVNSAAEIDRLIAAEHGGKTRKSALAALHARREAIA